VSYIVPRVSSSSSDDQLHSVAFSVRNESTRAVASATFRIVVRNPAKEPIDERTETRSFMEGGSRSFRGVAPDGKVFYENTPAVSSLPPGRVKQVEVVLFIRGFRTTSGSGSVDVQVVEVKFAED
jgi:hypothetical protein